ncbi:MAG: nucleotide-binding protein [Flavobacteriales bacterium]|nr:nucleotide-binding protein [Flavobacteriales bacterium]MBK7940935.1 nucleotide-binding protein [Flavobacteriales bacterium]MBK9701642.1 nucleotide-binding protein [Flavobacteriales bacterium]
MRIFIGSSTEAVKRGTLKKLCGWIKAAGHEPLPWNQTGLFPPGSYTLQRLLQIASDVNGACFVFSEDDKGWYRRSISKHTRDNVILEYGMFTGRQDILRAIIVQEGRPRVASDLHGVTVIRLSNQSSRSEFMAWIKDLNETSKTATTKSGIIYTNKYGMPDANEYWSGLRDEARTRFYILGQSNKSWIERNPTYAAALSCKFIDIIGSNGECGIISASKGEGILNAFIKKQLVPLAKRHFKKEAKKKLLDGFRCGIIPSANYRCIISDSKMALMPSIMTPEFRDESLVLELHRNVHQKEYEYYLSDVKRNMESLHRPDLVIGCF